MEWVVFIFVVVYGVLFGISNFCVKLFSHVGGVGQNTLGKVLDVLFVFGIIYLLAADFHVTLRDFVQHTLN